MLQQLIKAAREQLELDDSIVEAVVKSARRQLIRQATRELLYDMNNSHEHANGRIHRHQY
jgi:hypothetical protein